MRVAWSPRLCRLPLTLGRASATRLVILSARNARNQKRSYYNTRLKFMTFAA
jgi:hypothetical protein